LVVNPDLFMAIKLNPPSPGRTVLGPRGGRRRSLTFKHWRDNAAGTPALSTVAGASGNLYPMMAILLKDGNTWNYLWASVGMGITWNYYQQVAEGTSSFTPNGSAGVQFTCIASPGSGVQCAGLGSITYAGPSAVMTMLGSLTGPGLDGSQSIDVLFSSPTTSYFDDHDLSAQPAGPYSLVTTFPDYTGSPAFINLNITVNNNGPGPITFTGSVGQLTEDFWSLYQIFNVPGYPGEWFGEWFNAVPWGNHIARVLNADLSAWLAAH
jgi:hypothetical protein